MNFQATLEAFKSEQKNSRERARVHNINESLKKLQVLVPKEKGIYMPHAT